MKIVQFFIILCIIIILRMVPPQQITQKNYFNGYMKTFTYTQMKVTFGKTHMAVQKNIDVPLLFTSSNY